MSENRDTLEVLARHLVGAIEPLQWAISSEDAFRAFMMRMGWQTTGLPSEYVNLGMAIVGAIHTIEDLADDPQLEEILDLVLEVKNAIVAIKGITAAPPGVDAGAFLAEIGERLFEVLLTDYLAKNTPTTFNALSVLNIIERENVAATAAKSGHTRLRFKWGEIPKIISDPSSLPERVYGWGTEDLNIKLIAQHIGELFFALDFPVQIGSTDELLADAFHAVENGLDDDLLSLKVPFYYVTIGGQNYEAAFSLMELKGGNGKLPGLILQPQIPQEFPVSFQLAPDIQLIIRAGTDLASHFGLILRPNEVSVSYPFQDEETTPSANFGIGFAISPESPIILFGNPQATRLQLKSFETEIGTNLDQGELEFVLKTALKDLAFIFEAGEGDGFINTILGDGKIEIDFSMGLDISSRHGPHFTGSGGFEIALASHLSLGPISIDGLTIRLAVPDDPKPKLVLELGTGISGDLGPLGFVIEGIGLRLNALFEDGNLGPLDLSIGFKPPNGVGLSVDAGVVKGGGYLFFDFDREEYAGALELVIAEWIALKAIGLVTTRLPDGSKGFSLLIIISVEFGSGIQLGFGFTLIGVGGLLGLNRTVKIEPLAEGVRTGGVDGIMFPEDVVVNAPRIISDLRTYFPPEKDLFLIGPMAKIGYGTPTLVSLSLGIIIEFPRVTITILGVLKASLPDEDAAVLKLQVNFIGRIEPANSLLWFYAELFDSRILFLTIEGGMGLLVNWGDNSNFVLSVGGFHPRYTPPPLPFPEPPRIAVNILNESWARIRVEGYFAVTSNTVQFGARVEIFIGIGSVFTVDGHLSLDVLFQFNPFYFIFELSVSLSVKLFGFGLFSVGFSGLLEGPTPWHLKGKGKIGFLFFSVSVPFDVTWGEERHTELPPIEVFPLIEKEFQTIGNWEAVVPAESRILVTLRQLGTADEDQLVLHPVGTLRISQRKLPLRLELEKFGNQKPADTNKHYVGAQVLTDDVSNPVVDLDTSYIKEKFARGEFKDLDNGEKLSSPGFELYDSGIEAKPAGEQLQTSLGVKRVIRYETIIIDNNFKRHLIKFYAIVQVAFATMYSVLFSHFLHGSAVTQSPLSKHRRRQLKPNDEVIKIIPNQYVVALNTTNQPLDNTAQFDSEAEAKEYMKEQLHLNPAISGQVHIIPSTEVNTTA